VSDIHPARATAGSDDRRLRAIVRAMDIGVLLLGADGGLDFANQRACELFGYADADELGRHWDGFRRLLEDAQARIAGTAPVVAHLEVSAAARSRRLRVELFRVEEEACEGCLALVKDRDLLDALESELALAIQMRGLTRFYMEVVHDLKAPLNAMVLNLELLKGALGSGGAPEATMLERQKRYIQVIGDEVHRLNRSLTSLLSQTPRLNEAVQRFELGDLLGELALLLEPQARSQRVAVELAGEGKLPLLGRRDRIKQALLNVAVNALEAMPDGGTLTIGASAIAEHAEIVIRDTGGGVPPEVMERIYDMHFTTKTRGTGIGLYVARSVVEAHQGAIRITTTAGEGTAVHIRLPLAPPPEA
jgi:signal transduction histidine kinase